MKVLRTSLALLAATLVTALALLAALWVWSGAGTSLADALDRVAPYLPSGQTLEAKDVTGTLREGGHIGWLRWQQGDLSLEAHDVRIGWTLRPLLAGELRFTQLAIGKLRIDDRRTARAPTPPDDLRLPLRVDAPFSADTVEWVGATALEATAITGHYIFNSNEHILNEGRARISSGTYQIHGRLQAQAPMALSAQLQGTVQTTLPSRHQALTVQAQVDLRGPLVGHDAALELQARLVPVLPVGSADAAQAMQASITARIQPWQAQPVVNATAQWQALDLAALWPQAPQTRLNGNASVTPSNPGWLAAIALTNTHSGPWNQQRLPLESLQAKVNFVDGQWSIESLQARGAGGRMQAQAKLAAMPSNATQSFKWQGSATVQGINPAALDSRLAATRLDGQLTAQQAAAGIQFDAHLQTAADNTTVRKAASSSANALDGVRLKTIHAQGQWLAPTLTLDTLLVQTDDAQLQGQLTVRTDRQAAQGWLALTLPGAHAGIEGGIASTQGQGEMHLQVTDAAFASRWLGRWPGTPALLRRAAIRGGAELHGHWQGGWQNQGQALQVQASLRTPQIDLGASDQPAGQAWQVRTLQADVSGTLRALNLTASGQAHSATRRFALQAQARAGQRSDGAWQAQLNTAQLTAQDNLRPGTWTMQLSESATLDWRQSGTSRTLAISAGTAQLTGPVPGIATLHWRPVHWSQQGTHSEWQSQGSLQGLPLAWLDLLGQTQMANLGLRGNLLFGGQWDMAGGESLRLRASLERTGGDLQVLTDDATASTLQAGVRDARLLLTADGERLAASLHWASERAGQAQADISTRLQRQDGAWTWPSDAPLLGTVRVQLPPVGAWSVLAPPGWRLRGTLDANAVLSGTRGAPQWRGTLQARDMAVRSVVDGIDFSNGTLQAILDGQRLDITSFTLQGAGGNSGGLLTIKGSVVWLPATGPATSGSAGLRMDLDATAQALRVSARADRRLVVSGKLSAHLDDARLAIRGTLLADQALFILAEDTAPQLGADVRVRSTAAPAPAPAARLRMAPDLAITLDLGQDFQVRGRGLLTRLEGNLELHNTPDKQLAPRLTGVLRTVGGTYKAYGQQLDIEQGVLRFAGPYDNPALDILAIRPNLQQRVGVQISGTALSPIVRLYAEPDLPDAEKLAWLVLGRSAASGGAEAAMLQQAALALLGGNGKNLSGGLAQALGLDELSVRGGASNTDGTTTGASVTLGKRLSRNFYVAYERSLAGTLGTFYIFYDLSRRFTLRAQTGEQSAVDLIFTLRYD